MLCAANTDLSLAVHLGVAVAIPAGISVLAGRLSPRVPSAAKSRPYECGVSEPLTTATSGTSPSAAQERRYSAPS